LFGMSRANARARRPFMQLRPFVRASLVLAVLALWPAQAEAQATRPVLTFDAVTSYTMGNVGYTMALTVTGVQQGASGPSTVTFWDAQSTANDTTAYFSACERQLLVAINRPGRFSIGIAYSGTTPPSTGTVAAPVDLSSRGCTLTQRP
jgi:hypothetical protein